MFCIRKCLMAFKHLITWFISYPPCMLCPKLGLQPRRPAPANLPTISLHLPLTYKLDYELNAEQFVITITSYRSHQPWGDRRILVKIELACTRTTPNLTRIEVAKSNSKQQEEINKNK